MLAALADAAETDVTANLAINILLQKRLPYLAGKLNIEDMVTREYPLEEINDGFRNMLESNRIRGIVRYV